MRVYACVHVNLFAYVIVVIFSVLKVSHRFSFTDHIFAAEKFLEQSSDRFSLYSFGSLVQKSLLITKANASDMLQL